MSEHPSGERPDVAAGVGEALDLFRDDFVDRALARVGLPADTPAGVADRVLAVWAVAVLPAALEGRLLVFDPAGAIIARLSLLGDVPFWTQIVFFIPFSVLGERLMRARMATVVPHVSELSEPATIARLVADANRFAPSRRGLLLLVPAFVLPWLWARTEIANGVATWSSVVAPGREAWFAGVVDRVEWFSVAGLWVAFVSLPIFTLAWLRWVWKIVAWTTFLARVSRRRLRLMAVHPDRVGGLGTVSDVQPRFSWLLLGVSVLFAGFIVYKLRIEPGTNPETLWIPVIVYGFLGPGVFLAPLFLFTKQLRATKDQALERLQPLIVDVAKVFRDRWLVRTEDGPEEVLHHQHTSHLADLHAAHGAVREMRVVPFDLRSARELFIAAFVPFGVLVFLSELPEKVAAFFELLG